MKGTFAPSDKAKGTIEPLSPLSSHADAAPSKWGFRLLGEVEELSR